MDERSVLIVREHGHGSCNDAMGKIGGFVGEDMIITETEDFVGLEGLFARNGLEVTEREDVPTEAVKLWEALDDGGARVGGCALSLREGRFIIDGIAVEEGFRGAALGKALLWKALDEVRGRGGQEVFLVARAPGFFRTQGFVTVDRADAPLFFECFGCSQYGVTCFPEVMRYRYA